MIDKELLWKAWPDGYLAMRGVSTVDGWLCSGEARWWHPDHSAEIVVDPMGLTFVLNAGDLDHAVCRKLHANGGLLPNVDPTDPATWACLLLDLARASNLLDAEHFPGRGRVTGLMWESLDLHGEPHKELSQWHLRAEGYHGFSRVNFHKTRSIVDSALALVTARIYARERLGR